MRKFRLAASVATLAVALAAPTAGSVAQPTSPTAHSACRSATILGRHKCLARGQFCTHTRAANRDYHRYGYHCGKRDPNGRYHLVSY